MKTDEKGFDEERTRGYDERVSRHIPGYDVMHSLCETILAAELPDSASVLVGGVGTGMEILQWAPKHPGWRFMGIDPSEPMLASARKKVADAGLDGNVELKVGAIEALDKNKAYDAATLLLVLHFVADKELLLNAIRDRLKPGAPFLMATMFGDPDTTRYKRLVSLQKRRAVSLGISLQEVEEIYHPERKDMHMVSEERIKEAMRVAGFIDVQRVYQALTIGLWLARAPR